MSRTFVCSILCCLALLVLTPAVSAQEQTRFVLKLDTNLVSSLRTAGSLSSNVDPQFKNRISMIDILFSGDSEASSNPESVQANISVNDDVATIGLDDAMISRIESTPIRINVPSSQRNFSKIVLNYRGSAAAATPADRAPMLNEGSVPVGTYFVRLKGNEQMSGSIDDLDQFSIETGFGKISMPMEQVAGIKFQIDGRNSALVVLNNGDSITGKPVIPSVALKTDWGEAEIEPAYIESIMTTPNAKFVQETTDFGLRWTLKTGVSFAPGPNQ